MSHAKKEPVSEPRLKAAGMTPDQAQAMSDALSTYNADHGTAVAALKQLSAELSILQQAMFNGANASLVHTALAGILQRADAASKLAEDIDEMLATTTHGGAAVE